MIGDIGNSGHFGHRHLEDQYPLWTKGETRELWRAKDDVTAENDGLLRLEP
jgi:acyl-homoserine lactone acylase PvdQ